MSDKNSYLHLLLSEPIYLVDGFVVIDEEKQKIAEPNKLEVAEPEPIVNKAEEPIAPQITSPEIVERKPLGVMVNYSNSTQFPESERVLLANILKAVGFDMSTIEMIFVENAQFQEEQTKFYHKLIVFGLNANIQAYQIHKKQDCQILMSDSLAKISADVTLKKQLWVQLQSMFGK